MIPQWMLYGAGAVFALAAVLGVARQLTLRMGVAGKPFGAFYLVFAGALVLGLGVAGAVYYSKMQRQVLEEPK